MLNLLYGGIEFESEHGTLLEWLKIHYKMLVVRDAEFFKEKLRYKKQSRLEELIKKEDPDYLVLNEVMPNADYTLEILEKFGYKYHYTFKSQNPRIEYLWNATLIASKNSFEIVKLDSDGDDSASNTAIYDNSNDLLIISCHPSAFNRYLRMRQLRWISLKINELRSRYQRIIFTGDLNAEPHEVLPILKLDWLKLFSAPSFPTYTIYNELVKPRNYLLSLIMLGFKRKVRAIDYFLYTDNLNPKVELIDAKSDHMGISSEF